jgi:hypothetical protein
MFQNLRGTINIVSPLSILSQRIKNRDLAKKMQYINLRKSRAGESLDFSRPGCERVTFASLAIMKLFWYILFLLLVEGGFTPAYTP